jgi:hypothetical protein
VEYDGSPPCVLLSSPCDAERASTFSFPPFLFSRASSRAHGRGSERKEELEKVFKLSAYGVARLENVFKLSAYGVDDGDTHPPSLPSNSEATIAIGIGGEGGIREDVWTASARLELGAVGSGGELDGEGEASPGEERVPVAHLDFDWTLV